MQLLSSHAVVQKWWLVFVCTQLTLVPSPVNQWANHHFRMTDGYPPSTSGGRKMAFWVAAPTCPNHTGAVLYLASHPQHRTERANYLLTYTSCKIEGLTWVMLCLWCSWRLCALPYLKCSGSPGTPDRVVWCLHSITCQGMVPWRQAAALKAFKGFSGFRCGRTLDSSD